MMDREKMVTAVRMFLDGIGHRADAEDVKATPDRVARAWSEDLVVGYERDPAEELTWTEVEAGRGPVLVRRISFASICVHHLLPFFGFAGLAYLPGTRQAGLSKLGRVVDAHARRLQTQEHLTESIVKTVDDVLAPAGVIGVLEAEHTCMTIRGVRKEQSRMMTMATAGAYRDDAAARRDVLALLRAPARGALDPG
jgi:GTP cyclohydrolase I